MPMTRESRMEKVQRLSTAHTKTKEILEGEPLTRELHPGTDIARNWTVITAAYSGLEQTLKYLIAEERDLTIAELINYSAPKRTGNIECETGKYPYRTHNLCRLYSKLEESTRNVVQDFYGRFQSLHSYITVGRVDKFLDRVSGPGGTGYERWRYSLIEDTNLPKNSPEALLAIWDACIQIAEYSLWKNQKVRMPDKELTQKLRQLLNDINLNVSVERHNAGEPLQNTSGEIKDWLWSKGHPLNAFADVLWHFARFGTHGVVDIPEWAFGLDYEMGECSSRGPSCSGTNIAS